MTEGKENNLPPFAGLPLWMTQGKENNLPPVAGLPLWMTEGKEHNYRRLQDFALDDGILNTES
jgi:hypothetical protein